MNTTKQTLKIFWQHAWHHKRYPVALLINVPLSTAGLRLVPPLIAAEVIRRLGSADFVPGDFWASFDSAIIIYTIVAIMGGIVLTRINMYLVWRLETLVNRDLARTMFNHYMRLDVGFHENSFGGSLVSRTNKLIGAYIRFADTLIFQLLPTIISFVFIIIVMYPRSPLFAVGLLVFSLVFVAVTYAHSKKVGKLATIEANAEHATTGALADAVTNILAIKSFGRVLWFIDIPWIHARCPWALFCWSTSACKTENCDRPIRKIGIICSESHIAFRHVHEDRIVEPEPSPEWNLLFFL